MGIKPKAPKADPSLLIVECELEGCDKTMTIGDSYSFVGVAHAVVGTLATTGPLHILPTQCDQEQHFACSLEHAIILHGICLQQHIMPKHNAKVNAYILQHAQPVETSPEPLDKE